MRLFGTDGIRALVNDDLMSPEMGVRMGTALVAYCRKRNLPAVIVIGRDTRQSGPMLEAAVVSGILSMGGDAVIAGVIPTPGLAYLVQDQKAGAGLVISASHNPYQYNGLKPFNSDGTKLTDEQELEIEHYIKNDDVLPKQTDGVSPGKKILLEDAEEKYVRFLSEKMPKNLEADNLKIALDCANGATYKVAPIIFSQICSNMSSIFIGPDGKNINDNCGSQHTGNLKKEVLAKKADLGLAFDGDGDRMIAIDEKGKELTGDHIIYIIAKMMKEKGELKNDAVVTTVMSNIGFINDLRELDIKHFSTDVGDRKVYFKMKKEGSVLGGEEAGHIIIPSFQYAGDGVAGGLMLIAAINHFKKPLSELAAEVTLYPKLLVNVEVKKKPVLESVPEIRNIISEVEEKLGDFGRVLVRYSGTENLCRVMVEGRDKKEITEYADRIAKVVSDKLN